MDDVWFAVIAMSPSLAVSDVASGSVASRATSRSVLSMMLRAMPTPTVVALLLLLLLPKFDGELDDRRQHRRGHVRVRLRPRWSISPLSR